ncbi:MAG: LysR family transcriptional regulator [Janthinobacterium lividum]
MQKLELAEYLTFVEIVDRGGLAKAATQLGVTPSAVSQTLRKLEERLGAQLLIRSTRSVQPTELGGQFADRLKLAFSEITRAAQAVSQTADSASGTIRLTVSAVAAELLLGPHLTAFKNSYPGVQTAISVNDQMVDIVEQRFDAGIRRGDILAADMMQQRLSADIKMLVVAAPSYLKNHSVPREPADLRDHDCIRIWSIGNGGIPPWRFMKKGKPLDINVDGNVAVDTTTLALSAVLKGSGVAYLASDYLAPYLATGQLISLLDRWAAPRPGFFLYYSTKRQVPHAVQLLGDFLSARMQRSSEPLAAG